MIGQGSGWIRELCSITTGTSPEGETSGVAEVFIYLTNLLFLGTLLWNPLTETLKPEGTAAEGAHTKDPKGGGNHNRTLWILRSTMVWVKDRDAQDSFQNTFSANRYAKQICSFLSMQNIREPFLFHCFIISLAPSSKQDKPSCWKSLQSHKTEPQDQTVSYAVQDNNCFSRHTLKCFDTDLFPNSITRIICLTFTPKCLCCYLAFLRLWPWSSEYNFLQHCTESCYEPINTILLTVIPEWDH